MGVVLANIPEPTRSLSFELVLEVGKLIPVVCGFLGLLCEYQPHFYFLLILSQYTFVLPVCVSEEMAG